MRVLILFFLLVSIQLRAQSPQNYALYFGGGNGGGFDTALFESSYEDFKNLKGWKKEIYYSGNKEADGIFDSNNFFKKIESYISNIESGKITSGSQLLFYLATHGTINDETNEYEVRNKKELMEVETLLMMLKNACDRKGVKLAIVASTCYSGAIQSLGDNKTCVISATQQDRSGWDFPILKAKAKNLEDAFLKTRKSFSETAQPMISTVAGQKVENFVKNYKPFLRNYFLECNQCSPATPGNIASILKMEKMISPAVNQVLIDQSLENDIETYQVLYKKISERESSCIETDFGKLCYNSTLSLNEKLEGINTALVTNADKDEKLLHVLKIWQTAIVQHQKSDAYKKFEAQETLDIGSVALKTNNLLKKERQAYDVLYKKFSDPKKPNPCRDFKL